MSKGIMDLPEGATDSDPRWQRGYADGETDRTPAGEDHVYVAGWCTGHCGAHQTTQAAAEAAYRLAATRTITVGDRTIPLNGMGTAPRDGTPVWIVDRFGGVDLMRVPPAPFSLTDEFVPMWVPDDPVEIGHGAWSNEHLVGWVPREALPDGLPPQGSPKP